MNSAEQQRLQAQWQELLASDRCPDPSLKDAWWVRLRDHYSESARHYHTLHHIDSMFRLFEGHRGKLTEPAAVGWAIFFHEYGNGDEHFFLDFDMEVLGWPDADYDRYAQQIRQEYIHVPEGQYRMARAQVLKEFLKTPNIYATKEFRDSYEGQARANIEREIRRLEGG